MPIKPHGNSIEHYRNKLEKRRQERSRLFVKSLNEPKRQHSLTDNVRLEIEKAMLRHLNDPLMDLPISSDDILFKLKLNFKEYEINYELINKYLFKYSTTYQFIKILEVTSKRKDPEDDSKQYKILSVDSERIGSYLKTILKDETCYNNFDSSNKSTVTNSKLTKELLNNKPVDFLENLLSHPSVVEFESRKSKNMLNNLLMTQTTSEKLEMESFKSIKSHVQEYCPYGTKEECFRNHYNKNILHKKCEKIHFKRILKQHTDISLGDCSFLNTCYNINNCKYIHYEVDMEDVNPEITLNSQSINNTKSLHNYPPQWVQCDLRSFDMNVLGKFAVIMADPPWDIHMELPYGTMADEEMKKLDIPSLQDDGYIFLWVTGRAMELGRECLKEWNYERVDELIWVKTNQLQRIIRTGRTGHWLNHGKEHCLVGVKGKPNPELFNKAIDCDIIVAEVRATSHKPDEIYGVIERLSPGTRKVELFGRPHNVKPNWITLGNQLDGVRLIQPEVVQRFKTKYPDGNCMPQITSKD